ncbi:UDP-glucose 4-epimerase family protein [Rheinheimera sp. EpRS3]|uniref:UDP-glucose 4-epimerase family protein n=1 Tax=Rheinheimera sp. EpRS3 TaxID=1712383 RepID=UPI0007485744|nr:SDR family oxidoreductase [Rheinheimera sp. EpRS3]KUM52489.1 hypothetical protein AR688_09310 [Rheinheimera sp. EpRS3]
MLKRIIITGCTGFVGSQVLKRLKQDSFLDIKSVVRNFGNLRPDDFVVDNIDCNTDYSKVMQNVGVIVHIAARVHVMADTVADPLDEYRAVNVAGTLNLARQAAASGVKRFVFVSSIKVNGEATSENKAFRYDDTPTPEDPYSISKAEAESGLKQISAQTGMEVVIIRPPLVYGPGVKANFAAMMKLARINLPLPLGAIHNKRSLVALDNLVDLIVTCIEHPNAANQTFLVSDDQDVSTTELLQMMTRAAGKMPRLLPVPVSWLKLAGKVTGKQAVIDRLCGNLQLDISHTKDTLDWTPPVTVEEGIARCFTAKG